MESIQLHEMDCRLCHDARIRHEEKSSLSARILQLNNLNNVNKNSFAVEIKIIEDVTDSKKKFEIF